MAPQDTCEVKTSFFHCKMPKGAWKKKQQKTAKNSKGEQKKNETSAKNEKNSKEEWETAKTCSSVISIYLWTFLDHLILAKKKCQQGVNSFYYKGFFLFLMVFSNYNLSSSRPMRNGGFSRYQSLVALFRPNLFLTRTKTFWAGGSRRKILKKAQNAVFRERRLGNICENHLCFAPTESGNGLRGPC